MAGPPVLNGPFTMPMFNGFVPRRIQPWIYLFIAFCFQLSSVFYSGNVAQIMGDTCLMREDVMMVIMCGVVGVNMPFPFLFRFKFRFTNRQLLTVAALVVAACNFLATLTESFLVLCLLSYVAGFFKLCGTFECMSNIQLWMTPKRDFRVFFPLLYCIVVGNMFLSPLFSAWLTYATQDWLAMNYLMTAVMLAIAVAVRLLTHDFRFMKPLPLFALDWFGMLLWSSALLGIIFIFNYGEHYNWWDGQPIRVAAVMTAIAAFFAIGRMRHIRHPYIAPGAWMYKRLIPLLVLFAFVELMGSTPKVLQSAFLGSTLHYGWTTTTLLNIPEWIGTIVGCMFCLWWTKVMRFPYTRLLTIGVVGLLAYAVMMYFLIDPGLPLWRLYLPIACYAFGNAIFFSTLTVYLEELMPFQHFFMGLTMAGFVRNGPVSNICGGAYSYGMRYLMADNLSRGLPYDGGQLLTLSLRYLYGVTCFIGCAVLIVFLLWDIQPVRSTLKKMPAWNFVGRSMRRFYRRQRQQMLAEREA